MMPVSQALPVYRSPAAQRRRHPCQPAAAIVFLVALCGAAWMMHAELGSVRTRAMRITRPPSLERVAQPGSNRRDVLLSNWCVASDQAASGWSHLTPEQCMWRFSEHREAAEERVRNGTGLLFFKHVHKAGGSTMCQLGQRNMAAEDVALPFRPDWTTNCVPYEAFLGAHTAVSGGGGVGQLVTSSSAQQQQQQDTASHMRRRLAGAWLGGACFFGFLTPAQLRGLSHHFRPLTFVASEGPMPDVFPLDAPFAMFTMLRHPLDRVLSSYKWWQFMVRAMPSTPAECRAYWAPANATLQQWLTAYPDNWMTRELAGGLPAPLTPAEVARAKARLHYFSAVLVMERWEDSMELVRQRFGWTVTDFQAHRTGSQQNSSAEQELRDHPGVLAELKRRNAVDMELHQYALALHEAQLEESAAAVGRGR